MEKRLSRNQKFDIFMGFVELFYFLFPWINSGERRYNIPGYLIACLKADDVTEVYNSVFRISAEKFERIPHLVRLSARYLPVTYMVITAALAVSLVYILAAVRKKTLTKTGKLPFMVAQTVCALVIVDIMLEDYGSIYEGKAWESAVPGYVCALILLFLILEGIWMIGSLVTEELDRISLQIEEERRKAELHRQEILESYIANLERMIDETRAFRHDYKNILSTMAGFIRENQMDELREFFYKQIKLPEGNAGEQQEAWKYLKNIYPMELKGFLYEKILMMLTRDIRIQVQSSQNVNVTYRDMEALIRLLGIFIDNAVEEAETFPDGEVEITIIKTEMGILFCIENNYQGNIKVSQITEKGYSTKGEGRGLGLYLAQEILKEHEDMVHELRVTDDRIIQQVEVLCER